MPSTVIRAFDYDAERRELTITFTTGRFYIYADVPARTVEDMKRSGARGIYFNKHIRGAYAYREIQ